MAAPLKVTDEQIEAALWAEDGLITHAATRLGISRVSLRERLAKRKEHFDAILSEAREAVVDSAERCVKDKIADGDLQAAQFMLRTIGRKRGYGERTEITGADGGPLEVADARPALAARLAALAAGSVRAPGDAD